MTIAKSTRAIGPSIRPRTAMLLSTAAPGGIAVQVSELSMSRRSGGGGDAAGERARETVGEIAGAMAGQMIEQLEADVAADRDEDIARDPAGEPPQQVIAGDEAEQQRHRAPRAACRRITGAQHVDQMLDAILRADGAADRRQHSRSTTRWPIGRRRTWCSRKRTGPRTVKRGSDISDPISLTVFIRLNVMLAIKLPSA